MLEERNLRFFPFFFSFYSFFPILAVLAVLVLERGLSLGQLLALQATLLILPVLLEIPTGYFADVYGRKTSLIIATLSYIASVSVLLFAESFSSFFVAIALMGVALAFESGADSAFVYDTLLSLKRTAEYKSRYGFYRLLAFTLFAIASFIAGPLAEVSLDWPIFATLASLIVALVFSMLLVEPKREKPIMKGHVQQLTATIKTTFTNPLLHLLMLYGASMGPVFVVFFILIQPLVQSAGLSTMFVAFYYGAGMLLYGLGSFMGHRVVPGRWLFLLTAVIGGTILIIAGIYTNPLTLLLIPIVAFLYGTSMIAVSELVNKTVTSDKRATVMSIYAQAVSMTGAIFSLAAMPFAALGIETLVVLSGTITLIGGSAVSLILLKNGH